MVYLSICLCHLRFLHQRLKVLEYRSFASLGRFISRYLILFDMMINRIISLISLSDPSLPVYRNATNLCVLILYPANLLYSLM